MPDIFRLDAAATRAHLDGLAEALYLCVKAGASVGFVEPFTIEAAREFFTAVAEGVGRNERILLAALEDGAIAGTVQILTATPPNQPHRADVAKLVVRPDARGRGTATALMRRVEEEALAAGRTLLVLDTATGSTAERLYLRLGWTQVGVIPDYALFPAGGLGATTVFYKRIDPADAPT